MNEPEYTDKELAEQLRHLDQRMEALRRVMRISFYLLIPLLIAATIIGTVGDGVRLIGWTVFSLDVAALIASIGALPPLARRHDRLNKQARARHDQRERERQKREGLFPLPPLVEIVGSLPERQGIDHRVGIVRRTEWKDADTTRATWVDGEARELLPSDLVLRWNHRAWGGLCIARNNRVIASINQWHIDF